MWVPAARGTCLGSFRAQTNPHIPFEWGGGVYRPCALSLYIKMYSRNSSGRKTLHKTLTWGMEAMSVDEVTFTEAMRCYWRNAAMSYGCWLLNVERWDGGKMSACLELATGKVLPHMEMSVWGRVGSAVWWQVWVSGLWVLTEQWWCSWTSLCPSARSAFSKNHVYSLCRTFP